MFALVACTEKTQVPEPVERTSIIKGPSPELSAIDSLMWHYPDSALWCLIPYFDTCCRDAKFCVSTTTEHNRHYANLLLAELLYKNDYEQTNRTELLQAVTYYDSLVDTYGTDTRGVSLRRHNRRDASHASATTPQSIAFLDARAHYINGVGYYEQDSLVQACAEYLKALEMMESHFEEKELVEKKAKFMAYTYNRLGDMFSEQFMMEPAINCYENAFVYCKIESTSPQGISNILSRLGLQYDKLGDKEKMRDYYTQALEAMPNFDNLSYRDLLAGIALSDYQLGYGIEQSLEVLRKFVVKADDESERLTRYLTIGAIFAEEGMYDSAMYYLEPILENGEDKSSQIQAAECLRIIYDSIGDNEKLDYCLHFLAIQKKSESQNKALVSRLESLFKNYLYQKQEELAKEEQETAVQKAIRIIIPFVIAIVLAIIIIARLRGKKLLNDKEKLHQQEIETNETRTRKELEEKDKRHAEAIEAERQAHRMEQAAMSGRLKRSNQEVRELKDQIKRQDELNSKPKQAESFKDEPVCRLIMKRVNEGQFKSKIDCIIYKDYALNKQQILDLRLAVDRYFGQFTVRLKKAYPELTNADLDYCCLYLLGLTDADVAALMQRAYNTVIERNGKMRKIFGSENPLPIILMRIANDSLFI